ncbi:hypothetical protein GJ633_14920, partial [Halorubrum sp. CBA1125]|nr:hypothetical protein [Halorubrum sp. CBA1125]
MFSSTRNNSIESVETSVPEKGLLPGEYEARVRTTHGHATTTDSVTFTLQNRSTSGVETYAAEGKTAETFDTAGAVHAGIANGTLEPTSTVSPNHTVVYAVNATGLTGLAAARNASLDTGRDLERLDGLAFGVRLSDGVSTLGDDLGSTPAADAVHVDESNLFLVADGDDALG